MIAQALFSLRALFGATQIQSYARMASMIRMWLSDLYTMRCRHFRRGKPLGATVPQDENIPTCAPSGLEPPTYHILRRQH